MLASAVLLAGGKSTRMGRDKALLDFDRNPLWQRQLDVLRKLTPNEILISGSPRKEWDGYELVGDEIADAGPMAGVGAALQRCRSPLLIVLAIDLPWMTSDYLRSLLNSASAETGIVPLSAHGFEPLAAIYPRRCSELAESCLQSGDFSMQHFVARACEAGWLRAQPVLPNELALFENLNTPADYERALSCPVDQSR